MLQNLLKEQEGNNFKKLKWHTTEQHRNVNNSENKQISLA